MTWVGRVRWRLRSRRCVCGAMRLARGTSAERAGVKHRTDGPCFHCDTYGNTNPDWWRLADHE